MTVYCGVDFHARQQTVCYCDTADGALHLSELEHEGDNVRGFYSRFTDDVVVGIEASGYSTWFVELLEGLGHRVLIGDAAEVRRLAKRRQKNDRRDAGLILDLLLRGEFPQVHRPPFESREVLRLLRHRHKLVQIRTRAKNGLQALAFSAGSSGRSRLLSREGREQFLRLEMSEAMGRQREEWLSLVDDLNRRIKSLDAWLDERARRDERVLRLQTHPGIGLLTSLALVHALELVHRFSGGRKVAAYVGLDPMEYSSGERQRFGSISKGGSRLLRYLLVEAARITIEFMLSAKRDVHAAKRFFKKLMRADHRRLPFTVGTDKHASYPEAFAASVREKILPSDCKLRRVKYLNNVIEQDHRFIRRRWRAMQCFRSFHTAERTLEGVEAAHMMRKGQVKRLDGRESIGQARFVASLFGVAA